MDVIFYSNDINVPNDTSIFAHWSVLNSVLTGGLRRLERGTFEFGQKRFQPSLHSRYVQFDTPTEQFLTDIWESKIQLVCNFF